MKITNILKTFNKKILILCFIALMGKGFAESSVYSPSSIFKLTHKYSKLVNININKTQNEKQSIDDIFYNKEMQNIALDIAYIISELDNYTFNKVVLTLLGEYKENSSSRIAIESILGQLDLLVVEDINKIEDSTIADGTLDGIFIGIGLVLMSKSSPGLIRGGIFKELVLKMKNIGMRIASKSGKKISTDLAAKIGGPRGQSTFEKLLNKVNTPTLFTTGVGVGIGKHYYDKFKLNKIRPKLLLERMQNLVILKLAYDTCKLKENMDELSSDNLKKEADILYRQLAYFKIVRPEISYNIPLSEDIIKKLDINTEDSCYNNNVQNLSYRPIENDLDQIFAKL